MSHTERLRDKIEETKREVFARDGWRCVICERRATQLGHILGQTDINIARWGEDVIHHPANMLSVCGTAHNKRVEISSKARPIDAARHAAVIAALLRREE